MKTFMGESTPALEKKVNAWLAKEGRKIKVVRSDTALKETSVTAKDKKGKPTKRKMRYVVTTLWYEPPSN